MHEQDNPAAALLDFTDDMLALLDTGLRYRTVNKAFMHLFGQPREYFIGRSSEEVFAHAADHYRTVIRPLMEGCLRGESAHYGNWVDVPNFGNLYLDIHYHPHRNARGEVIGVVVIGQNRTEIKRTIAALEESETLLNRTEHLAHLGGWFFDVATGEIEWTDEMYNIHEVDRDFELTRENINSFYPDDRHRRELADLAPSPDGKPSEAVLRMVTRKGNVKWVRSVAYPVIEDGRIVSVQGILQDITDYTSMEQRLRQSEEKYRRLVEETNALTWEAVAHPFCFTYMSPQSEAITGHSPEAWCTPGFLPSVVHPEDRDRVASTAAGQIRKREDFILEYRLRKDDGSWIWLHDNIRILPGESGKPLRLRGTMIDITAMKDMQAGLNRALRELESHKYILDQHAIVSLTDRDGWITYVNDKFIQLTGYSREEMIGDRHSRLSSSVHDEQHYAKIWAVIRDGQVWQGELCNRSKDGSLHWCYTTIVPLRDEKGEIEAFMSVRTDITDLKRTEESLRRVQKMEAIGQLTGGIAHDFNNLLGIILGNLELIEMSLPQDERLRKQLDSAKSAALRGSVLTRRLLNFSHQTPVQGKALDLNKVLQGLEVLVSKSLTALVHIDMDLAPDLWRVDADPGDFEDVLINLALNAGDAMPNGGRLSFATRNREVTGTEYRPRGSIPPGQYVEVRVQDTGHGIEEHLLDKVFDPYFSTKPSDKGSGLGLAMVYGFVQRCKGLIFVDSVRNKGTCFTLFLPRAREVPPEALATVPGGDSKLPARPGETLLLVDDEADILDVSRINLERLGYVVITCSDAEEALRVLASTQQVNLLFTDIVMPGRLSGQDLAMEARRLRPGLRILFTTGHDRVGIRPPDGGRHCGIINKPYRIAELSQRIRALLDA